MERRTAVPSEESSSTTSSTPSATVLPLTPQDRHSLNRIVTLLIIQKEWEDVGIRGQLVAYGTPYIQTEYSAAHPERLEIPVSILAYLHYRFIYHFPILETAPASFWTDRIQGFFDSIAEASLSSSFERSALSKRRMLGIGLSRVFGVYVASSVKSKYSSSPSRPSKSTMAQVENLVPNSMNLTWEDRFPGLTPRFNAYVDILENVEIDNTSFIIITELVLVKSLPQFYITRSFEELDHFLEQVEASSAGLKIPSSPKIARSIDVIRDYLRKLIVSLSVEAKQEKLPGLKKIRILLEAFLTEGGTEELLTSTLKQILINSRLKDTEREAKRREWKLVGQKSKSLRSGWANWINLLVYDEGELERSFALLPKHELASSLPEPYKEAESQFVLFVAYTLHFILSSEGGSDLLKSIITIHKLMPYKLMRLGLSLVNPTLAIKAFMKCIFIAPAGSLSLFQQLFKVIQNSGMKKEKARVKELSKFLDDSEAVEAVDAYVNVGFEEKQARKQKLSRGGMETPVDQLIQELSLQNPTLATRIQGWKILEPRKPNDQTEATKYETLEELLTSSVVLRDRKQVLKIALESNTNRLVQQTIAIFYPVIYKVAQCSKLSDRLRDVELFLDDFILVATSQHNESSDFVSLAYRHHEKVWYFLHEMTSNDRTLMEPLKVWCKSGLEFIRNGVPDGEKRASIDLDSLLSSLSLPQQQAIVREAKAVSMYSIIQKVYNDFHLRCDLIDSTTPGTRTDRELLFSSLIAQDPTILEYMNSQERLQSIESLEPSFAYYVNKTSAKIEKGGKGFSHAFSIPAPTIVAAKLLTKPNPFARFMGAHVD